MNRETTRALYEMFSPEDKNDFFPAYLYLKYIDHFMYHAFQGMGMIPKELPTKLDESTEEMMKAYVQQVAEVAAGADTNIYHGKVVKLKDALQLVMQKEDLTIDVPEQVVPFKTAKDIILRNPESIAIGTCVCRSVSETSCLPPPQEVCLFVGDPFASFIADQNPLFRRSSQEEAVKIIEEAHKRGDVHCAYFKKELGRRFFAICNCCDCCCVGVKMWNLLEGAVPFLAPSGYVAEVSDECNACGSCAENTCRFYAISMDAGGEKAIINLDKCMGCGVCEDMCPIGAISLRREPSKGEPLDIEALKT